MESLETARKPNLQLEEKLSRLNEELNRRGRILSSLIEERNKLLQGISQETVQLSPDETLPHYKYILPLVKEIHILELKLKEKQREYENKKLQCEAARLGDAVLVDSFREDECVLKRWSKELSELSSKAGNSVEEVMSTASRVTNITYDALVDQDLLTENLAFTVLCQAIHVRLQMKSEVKCTNIHLPLFSASSKIGVNSDTHIPKLEDTVFDAISNGRHISSIVSLVSQYIQEEMAPYAIIIPMKKKGETNKSKLSKPKQLTSGK
ncbi:hypothetical protein BsWGS_14852 [Bradybaena similaris]